MRDKIALHVCPTKGCAFIGKKGQPCSTHDKDLVRRIYVRETDQIKADELRHKADAVRAAADKVKPPGPFDQKLRETMGDINKAFGL